MLKLILLSTFIVSSQAIAAYDCAKFFRFNSSPRDYVSVLDETVPGSFKYQQRVSRNGSNHHEMYERSDGMGRSYGHVLFDYHKNQETVVIANLKSVDADATVDTILVAKMMSEFPYAKNLQTSLDSKDYSVYLQARQDGLTKLNALKEMPTYKILNKVGFAKINTKSTVIEDDYEHIVLVLNRE
jgi:hypothetical protein